MSFVIIVAHEIFGQHAVHADTVGNLLKWLTLSAAFTLQENGEYIGFDTSEFTSRSGGKLAAIKAIKVMAHAFFLFWGLASLDKTQLHASCSTKIWPDRNALQAHHNYYPMVMIGDGATDLEARQEGGADLFIG